MKLCLSTLALIGALIGAFLSSALSLESNKVGEVTVCPRKQHLIGGRVCKKACTSDNDCIGRRKKCVCDDVCGLTCLNPKGKCPHPKIVNGKARVSGKNQLGAVAKYFCTRGYELDGVETRICNGDRQWSGTAPRCVPSSTSGRGHVSDLPHDMESSINGKASHSLTYKQCPEPPSVTFADHNGPKQSSFLPDSTVTYTCRSGFMSEGIAMAKCMTSGVWAGPLMSCREDRCPDFGELAHGDKYGDSLEISAKINYECKKGYRLIGNPMLTCIRGGVWDYRKPVCQQTELNTCEKPSNPKHGKRIGRSYTLGSVVSAVCNSGYKLSGTPKRVCQQDGTWSGTPPKCLPVDCGSPGELWNGYIESRRFTLGSIIRYRCLDGAKFDGLSVSATCLETGDWSFPMPRCLRSCVCPEIRHARTFLDSRPAPLILDHGSRLEVVCDVGLTPNEKQAPVCNNGTWTSLPLCVQGGCDHRPKEIANGMALYRGTKYGDRVRYTCNAGHKLIGDIYLTCDGGEWKGNVPECKAVYCPHPGNLANGNILLVGDIGKFEYRPYVRHAGQGEKIEYYCSKGYRLEGPSAATCIDGTWSPEVRPQCINNQHPMLPKTKELFTT